MNHFIVDFSVVIDGGLPILGTIGSATMTKDYQPNIVKQTILEQMKKNYPNAKNCAVIIINANEVTNDQYYEASRKFIEITE